eukprot:gene16446-18078_t
MAYRRRQSPGPRNKKGKCFNGGLKGHRARDCTRTKKPKESRTEDAQIATTDSHSLFSTNSTSALDESLVWYVDSGNNRLVEAEGKGTIWIKLKVGDEYKPAELSDVLYVPILNKNLFSVSTVTKKGFSITFDANQCATLDRNGIILGSGRSDGKLYTLDASPLQNDMREANTASDQSTQKPSKVTKVDSSTSTDEVQVISITSEDEAQNQSEDCSEDQVEDIVDNATDSSAEDLPENIQENQMPRKSTREKQIPDKEAILTGDGGMARTC